MNIICCTSNEYSPYLGTMLISLFTNNKGKIIVNIFSDNIDSNNKSKFEILARQYNQEINIYNITKEELGINAPGSWGIYPYLKLYAPVILKGIDKAIYIDTDMIILRDITKIEQINLEDYYVAMAYDCQEDKEHKKRLSIPNENFYGNSGFIYFNLNKYRNDDIWEKCKQFINHNTNIIKFADQDVINKICTGKIFPLEIEWNMLSFYYLNSPKICSKFIPCLEEKKLRAKIIHYTCIKPWYKDCDFHLKTVFIKYSKLSPWTFKYDYSPSYSRSSFYINKIRYFIQYLGLKKYPYLYKH